MQTQSLQILAKLWPIVYNLGRQIEVPEINEWFLFVILELRQQCKLITGADSKRFPA